MLRLFSDEPFGVGIVFIVDPTHTLPLIIGVVAAWLAEAAPVARLTVFSQGS